MNRLTRILKHRLIDERDARRALPSEALARIEARVAASERRHSGEIRVVIEAGLPLSYLWRRLRPRDRALTLFGKLRVWDTEANNGVLIYLLLAEHSIEIVADRGLNQHVDAAQWSQIVDGMRQAIRDARVEAALNSAIDAVDALLLRHFPAAADAPNRNELPDHPMLR